MTGWCPSRNVRRRAIVAMLLGLLLALFALPGEALAHAQLLSTDPPAGTVLDTAPTTVTLTFNEPVEISLGAVRLFDGAGRSVDVGSASHPGGRTSMVSIPVGTLRNGSYVVDWRVVSADSHPVHGAFTFQVGPTADLQPGILSDIIGSNHTGRPAGIGLALMRGLIIAGIAVVFGALVALSWNVVEPSRRLRRVIGAAAVVGAVAGVLQLPLEVGYATGRSLAVLFQADAWTSAFDTRPGAAWAIRAAILAAVAAFLLALVADRSRWWWRTVLIGGLIATGISSAYGGHGATGRWVVVGVLATAAHVAAMAVWFGGLVVLLVCFGTLSEAGLRRFSRLALLMVGLVVASGLVQSVRQLGSINALRTTNYGTLLIWKVMFVIALVMVASVSRKIVRRDVDRPRLRRALAIEAVLAVAIVVSTSLLMAANPSSVLASQPFSATLINGDYLASLTIQPGSPGRNELHLYLSDATSSLTEPDEVHVEISDPSRDVAAIEIPMSRAGASHYTTPQATFPYPATWKLTITARYNTFDEVVFTASVSIR